MEILNKLHDVLIVGGGIIGTFIARELSKYDLEVGLIEAKNDVGDGCSGANSAIVHSGYDPIPGTLKAKFNVLGNPMWDEIAEELDIHFFRIGSLTVAFEDSQLPILESLARRAKENGVEVKLLSAVEVKKLEPNINPNVKGALLAPTAGIVDPFLAVVKAMENAMDNGVKLYLNNRVENISKEKDIYVIKTSKGEYKSRVVINAAGVHSGEIASMVEDIDWKVIPRKGEYFLLDHFAYGFVNHTIFPLPSEKGKGVLFTLTTSGNLMFGPSSEEIEDLDDVSTDKLTLDSVKSQALNLIPNIPMQKVIRVFSGNRPTTTRHDFIIEPAKSDKNFINVAGIESPGLASAPAIAKYVVEELISDTISLKEKNNYISHVRKHPNLYDKGLENRAKFVKNNPEFGEIICNCEKISLGEIKDTLSRNVAPTSIKGIKKRCRAGFGSCQGGFCQSRIIEILADHYNLSPLDVLYDEEGSNVLIDTIMETK